MPSFNRNAVSGNQNQSGGGFQSAFAQILGANGDRSIDQGVNQGFYNNYDAISEEARRQGLGEDAEEREREERPREQMSAFDRLAKMAGTVAEGITGLSGFDGIHLEDGPLGVIGDVGGLMANTVLSMPAAPFSATQSLYEGFTGHNIQDANMETGELGERLNTNQRMGALATGAIDAFGLGHGGTGEALETGWNLVRGNTGKMAEKAADYTWKSFLGDVASEAAEEGVQSLTEDIRNDQPFDFSKAAESALYGGIGGGVLSGASWAVNRAIGGKPADSNTAGNPNSNQATQVKDPAADYFSYGQKWDTVGAADSLMRKNAEELLSQANASKGSASYTGIPGGYDIRPDQVRIGIRALRHMWQMDDESKDALVNSTRNSARPVTREELDAVFARDDADATNEFNRLIAEGAEFEGAVKRDPKTRDSSLMAFSIAGVDNGNAIRFNPLMPSTFGGDLDGDTWRLHFADEATRGTRSPMRYFMSPRPLSDKSTGERVEHGEPNFDFDFSGIAFTVDPSGKHKVTNSRARIALIDVLDTVFGAGDDGRQRAQRYIDRFDAGIREILDDGVEEKVAVSYMFQDMDTMAVQDFDDYRGDALIASILQELQVRTHVDKDMQGLATTVRELDESMRTELQESATKILPSQGSIGVGTSSIMQLLEFTGRVYQAFSTKENSALRTDQNIQWMANQVRLAFQGVDIEPDAFSTFVAWQMHAMDAGLMPYDALTSTFNGYVYQALLRSGAISVEGGSIGVGIQTADQFIEKFTEVYNEYLDVYNDALKQAGWTGEFMPVGVRERQRIDRSRPASFARAIEDVLGNQPIRILAGEQGRLSNYTLNDLLELSSTDGGTEFINMFMTSDEEFSKLFESMLKYHNTRQNARGKSIENLLDSNVDRFNKLVGEIQYDANGDPVLDGVDRIVLEYQLQAVREIIGVKAAAYFGLINVESAFRSPWGRLIFSGNKSKVKRAVGSMGLIYKYRDYIEGTIVARQIEEGLVTEEDVRKNLGSILIEDAKIMAAAMQNAQISRLDRMICEGIASGDDSLLRLLIDPTRLTWAEIDEQYEESFRNTFHDSMQPDNLMASMLKNDESDIGDGELSQRLRKAKTAYAAMENNSRRHALKTWAAIEARVTSGQARPDAVARAIIKLGQSKVCVQNLQIKAASIADAMYVMHDTAAKGTSPDSAGLDYMQMARQSDSVEDFLHRLATQSIGSATVEEAVMSKQMLMAAIFDPQSFETMFDAERFGWFELTREKVFESIGMPLANDAELDFAHLDALFKRYPQLITFVTETTFQPIPGSETGVREVMVKTTDKAVDEFIGSLDSAARIEERVERNEIVSRMMNKPAVQALVMGTVSARANKEFGYNGLDELMRRPSKFVRYIEDAYRDWANIIHYASQHVDGPEGSVVDSIRKYNAVRMRTFINEAKDNVIYLTREMKENANRVSASIMEQIQSDFTVANAMETLTNSLPNKEAASATHPKDVTSEIALNDNIDEIERAAKDLMVVLTISTNGTGFKMAPEDFALRSDVQQFRTDYIETCVNLALNNSGVSDPAQRKQIEDAVRQQSADEFDRTVDNLASTTQEIDLDGVSDDYDAITINDMDSADAMLKKIEKIAFSGRYGIFQKKEMPDNNEVNKLFQLRDHGSPADARRARRMLDNLRARWNSRVLETLMNDYNRLTSHDGVSGFLFATTEAINSLEDMIDEVRTEMGQLSRPDMSKHPVVPDLDFASPLVTALANHSQTIAESSGNSVNSGIEGGTYKAYLSLGAIDATTFNHTDDPDSRTTSDPVMMTMGELKQRLSASNNRFVNPYLHCRAVIDAPGKTFHDRAFNNVTLDTIQDFYDELNVRVYPLDRSAHGIGANTQIGVVRNGRGYVALKQLLMDFVYVMSEQHVFKRKKALNMFDTIVRKICVDNGLKNYMFDGIDTNKDVYEQLAQKTNAYREQVAMKFWDEFRNEQISDKFGKYDAMLLSQFTNPFISLKYADENGDFQYINMPVDALYNRNSAADFDALMGESGVTWGKVVEYRPMTLPIAVIMGKVDYEVGRWTSDFLRRGETPKLENYNTWVESALSDWDAFRHLDDGIECLLGQVHPLSSASYENHALAGAHRGSLRMMDLLGDLPNQRRIKSETDYELPREYFSDSENHRIMEFNRSFLANKPEEVKALKVAWAYVDRDSVPKTKKNKSLNDMLNSAAPLSQNSMDKTTASNDALAELVYSKNLDAVFSQYLKCRNVRALVLIPNEIAEDFRSYLLQHGVDGNTAMPMGEQGTIEIAGAVFKFVEPSNDGTMTSNMYTGPITYHHEGSRDEIAIMTATDGLASSSDAFSLISRTRADIAVPIDAVLNVSLNNLFGTYSGSRTPITKDNLQEELARFKEEFEKWVADDETSHFVYNPPEGYKVGKDAVVASVRTYLNNISAAGENGLISSASPMSTIWFTKVESMSGDWYAPVIVNQGGVPLNMSNITTTLVNPLSADGFTFLYTGKIAPTEYDGIKDVFDDVAWKAYESVATEAQQKEFPQLDMKRVGRKVVDRIYSRRTENSRMIERGAAVQRNNLFWMSRLIDCSLFFHQDGAGQWVAGNDALVYKPDSATFRSLVSGAITPEWERYASGLIRVFKDDKLDAIGRVVARYAIDNKIPPIYAFGCIDMDNTGRIGSKILFFEPSAIYGKLEPTEMLTLFHAIDKDICPKDYQSFDGTTYLNAQGEIRTVSPKSRWAYVYRQGHIQPLHYKMDSTLLGMPSGRGAFSDQQIINRAVLEGFHDTDMSRVTDMFLIRGDDFSPWRQFGRRVQRADASRPVIGYDPMGSGIVESDGRPSLRAYRDRKVRLEGMNFYRNLEIVESTSDKTVIGYGSKRVRSELEKLRDALGYEKASDKQLMALFKAATGSTYNEGDGSRTVTWFEFENGVNHIVKRLKDGKYPIQGGYVDGRWSIPIMPKPMQDWLYNAPEVQRVFNSREAFDTAAKTEFDKTREALATIKPKSRVIAISNLMAFVAKDNCIPWPDDNVLGYLDPYQLAHTENIFTDKFARSTDRDMAEIWSEREENTRQVIEDFNSLREARSYDKIETTSAPSGYKAIWLGNRYSGFNQVADTLITMSRANAVLTPLLAPSAIAQRLAGSGLTKAMIFLDNKGVQTYGGRFRNSILFERDGAPQRTLQAIAKDANVRSVWNALNELQLSGADIAAIKNANDADGIKMVLDNVRNKGGKLGRVAGKIFRMSTASGVGVQMQIENFFNYAASRLDPETSPWYFERSGPDNKTNFELMMETDPVRLLVNLTTATMNNPDMIVGLQARNFALDADLSQQTAASLILNEALARHSVMSFLLTTNVMKFPSYMFNVSGWYLKHVAPVSSLNYWATDMLIKSGNDNGFLKQAIEATTGVDISKLHLERTQVFASMQEAMVHDAIRLSATAIAGIIAGLAFEPPEDEDKMGNVNEWTFFGMRLDDVWWVQDILGPAFAIAATMKSAMIGRPRLDIIPNWLGMAMGNNPILKVGDVVGALFDEQSAPLDGMTNADDLYKGGDPSDSEEAWADMITYGMNWASQFLMPSMARELYTTTGDQWEHSYKRVYATDENGNIIYDESGNPRTVRTTYMDSRIRQLTRYNPFWAIVMNAFGDSKTSYWRSGMPRTVYYENAQLECMEYYSLYTIDPDTGQEVPRPVEERRAIAYEIISELQNNSVQQLVENGFMIDYETRVYVSQTLWDIRQYLQEMYNDWVQDTGTDANVVGEGDFQLGMSRISAIKEAYWSDYNLINDLYDKLWDTELASGPQKYNRYQTTYQQDQWGNWYATGFKSSFMHIVPFDIAPGTLSDPGSTMGWENDWDTESAVMPGRSTGERALIPTDATYFDTPPIESWAEDGDGEGYSPIWRDSLGDAVDADYNFGSDDGRRSYPYGRSYGYSRRSGGGGGGGGYSPNIYSRLPNTYLPSPRTMYAERIYNANYDYLRPNFETKGSREAYKRSDI